MQPEEEIARHALAMIGVPLSDTNVEHFQVLWAAMNLFDNRNSRYRDNWRRYGWRDSLHHCRSKLSRMFSLFGSDDPNKDLDDALDLINYAAFFIRNVKDGNEHGEQT